MKPLSLALAAACGLLSLAPVPVPAVAAPASQVAFFGPDEDTVEAFEKTKAALEAFERAVATPLRAEACYDLATKVYNEGFEEYQSGERARQHPDWGTIGARVDAAIAWVQSVRSSTVTHHPALGLTAEADIKLYKAVHDRADLDVSTPEALLAALDRLAKLGGTPAAKAAVAGYRRSEARAAVKEQLPEYLTMVREDLVHLARAEGPAARTDGRALERRVRTLLALGEPATTRVVLSEDPLSPLEATLETIQATARRRAAGQPATDPLSRAAKGVKLTASGYRAQVRAFAHAHTRGKPKAQALLREHGLPTTTRTGPQGTEQWLYRYTRNGISRVRILTLSAKDGSLLDLKERLD